MQGAHLPVGRAGALGNIYNSYEFVADMSDLT